MSLEGKIFKSRRVVLAQLQSLGYTKGADAYLAMTLDQIATLLSSPSHSGLDMMLEKPPVPLHQSSSHSQTLTLTQTRRGPRVYVIYYVKSSKLALDGFVEQLFENKEDEEDEEEDRRSKKEAGGEGGGEGEKLDAATDTLLVVMDEPKLNVPTQNTVNKLWNTRKIHVVVRTIPQTQFNLFHIQSVPPHRALHSDEVLQLMQNYNLSDLTVLPKISRFDPAASAILLRPDEVCECKRNSSTAVISLFYRLCTVDVLDLKKIKKTNIQSSMDSDGL